VLDGYDLMERDAQKFAAFAPPLVVLDDFLAPPSTAALVVNGAFHLEGERVGAIPALLGQRYALVDPRFAALPDRDRSGPVERLLVSFGRLDPNNATELTLRVLGRLGFAGEITVASSSGPNVTSLHATLASLRARARLVIDAPDMAPLLAESDFVIGAGGVSLMERMAAGVPSLTLVIAENQRLFVEGAVRLGATVAADMPLLPESLAQVLAAMLGNGAARAAMAKVGRRIIDGKGAARVARRLMALAEKSRHRLCSETPAYR
jgi:spore coat polysaccharide biosynthesis predicted glycosyltransferase SpsG